MQPEPVKKIASLLAVMIDRLRSPPYKCFMEGQSILGESGQFAPRRIVGHRRRTQSENLKLAESMAEFARRHVPYERRVQVQGDYFPVRKIVGRTRPR